MSKRKAIAILAIIAMVLTLMPAAMFGATNVDRLAGANRIETALEIASAGTWGTTVILAAANDANLVDALAAAPLAGQENAPILLTYKDKLDPAVKQRIVDLKATKVYVIGAVTDAVVNEVKALDGVTVEVLKGANRIETADAINAKLTNPAGTFVVGFDAIPDALSVASYAAKNKFAIVLTNGAGEVDSSKLVGATKYIVGGTAKVKDIAGVARLAGDNRYLTNKAVADTLVFSYDRVYVANGVSLVDALAVAPLAAKYNAFVALASANDVAAAATINAKLASTSKVIAVGGTSAVSDAVLGKIGFESSEPATVAVVEKEYDDDTNDQYIAFTVNGKPASVADLNADGWDVEFFAYTSKTGAGTVANFFADATTGLMNTATLMSIAPTDVWVEVTLTKGIDILTSSRAKVTIKNLNVSATGIDSYRLYNNTGAFNQESTTLVVGETAQFNEITVVIGSSKEDVTSGFTLKTSDASIISCDNSASPSTFTALAPGNATITISYAGATKAVNFKVVNDARKIKSIRAKSISKDTVISSLRFAGATGATQDVKVEALDQFGDPVPGGISSFVSSNTSVIEDSTIAGTSSAYNAATSTLTLAKGAVAGTATVSFYDSASVKIGTLSVTTSNNTTVAKKVFEMWTPVNNNQAAGVIAGTVKNDFSTDTTIDVAADKYVVYQVSTFNSDNDFLGFDSITATVVESEAGVVVGSTATVTAGNKVYVQAGKPGTITLKVTDSTGKIYQTKITVIDEGYSIKSISFKALATSDYAKTYSWKDVFTNTATGNDPIITGITLNKAAAQAIRFDTTTGMLYIDKDSDGKYSAPDINLGTLELYAAGTVGGVTNGAFAAGVVSCTTATGDDGTLIFRVWNPGKTKVIASTSVKVSL